MKLLLDENLPHDLRHFLAIHEAFTVTYMGWSGLRNGQLLERAARDGFDAVVTLDTGIEHQHNLMQLPCAVVILHAPSNKLEDLKPLVSPLLDSLATLSPRSVQHVR